MATLIRFLIVFGSAWCFTVASEAFDPDMPSPWRPRGLPSFVASNEISFVQSNITRWSYTKDDNDLLLGAAMLLPKEDAADVLAKYISAYRLPNKPTDLAWSRAVYCLGIVQSDVALRQLFHLWDEYDLGQKSGKYNYKFSSLGEEVNPTGVIADALRLYLWKPEVQAWAKDRISEMDQFPITSASDLNLLNRKGARAYLLTAWYSWLIIDSWAGKRDFTQDIFYVSPEVVDYSKAAKAVADITRELQPLFATMAEQDWQLIRRSIRDSGLDLVVNRLGSPLSFAIYKHYLSGALDKKNDPIILRLWLLALGGSLYEAVSQNELPLNADRESLLKNGYAYFGNLPAGYIREMGLGLLYSVSCYLPPDDQQSTDLKRSLGLSLSESQRTSIENRASKKQARTDHKNKPAK